MGGDAVQEFDRQVENLVRNKYHRMAGMTLAALTDLVSPLRDRAAALGLPASRAAEGWVSFVLVVRRELVPADQTMALTELNGRPGFADFQPEDLGRFNPVDEVDVPDAKAYLMVDVDTGDETLNRTPDDAMAIITAQGRTPLTIDEGIALVTHHPEALRKNHCFSLAGSRCGDRRVPALWISERRPKLGWCWAGNPHTWLGSASCASRAGP
jgi:hypothetical protein